MNSEPPEPWIVFRKNTGVLGGNPEGFLRLREAIDSLLENGADSVDVDGEEIQITELSLAETPNKVPDPPMGSGRNLAVFLIFLTLLLVLAGVGVVALVNHFL